MFALIVLFIMIAACEAQYVGYENQGPVLQKFAPPAPVGHDGNVIDTPEVAHAKAAHFAEFARAAARAVEQKNQGIPPGGYAQSRYAPEGRSPYAYASQPSAPAYARQAYPSQPIFQGANPAPAPAAAYPQHQQYEPRTNFVSSPRNFAPSGTKTPFIPAPLAEDGTVIDTPEVAALKATRLQELAEAEARAYKYGGAEEYTGEGQAYPGPQGGPGPLAYGQAPSPYGDSGPAPRAYPGQGFAAASPYQQATFQPQSFQSQQHAY